MHTCRSPINGLIIFFISSALSGCASFDGPKTARIWPSPMAGEPYPEQMESKFIKDEERRGASENDRFGIAFYGGGTRAAPAAVGQIRMLNEYGWFDRASYVSTISGGTWGVAPYIYLPDRYYKSRAKELCRNMWAGQNKDKAMVGNEERPKIGRVAEEEYATRCADEAVNLIESILDKCAKEGGPPLGRQRCVDRLYLGAYTKPESIKNDGVLINRTSEVESNYSSVNIMADNTYVFMKALRAWFSDVQGDETYADVLGNIFLKDVGLFQGNKLGNHAINKAFAYDESRIGVDQRERDFYFPREERPFLIAGTTLMRKSANPKKFFRFEITPLYTGSLGTHVIHEANMDDSDDCDDDIFCHISSDRAGATETHKIGGYVESYAFDARRLVALQPSAAASIEGYHSAFSLSDMLSASGAAPAQTGRRILGKLIGSNLGFPEFRYAAVIENDSKQVTIENWQQDQFGDGGHLENSGVMSLLARKVKRILVFVNSQQPFRADPLTNHINIDGNLVSLFQLPEYFGAQRGGNAGDSELTKIYRHYPNNDVFEEHELGKLVEAFKRKDEEHTPLVFCSEYSVQQNDRYNISPYKATICWVYLQPSKTWLDAITKCVGDNCRQVDDLRERRGDFENFPNYKTFLNDFRNKHLSLVKKDIPQANALSQFTSWTVQQSACEISRMLNLAFRENLREDYLPKDYNSKCGRNPVEWRGRKE